MTLSVEQALSTPVPLQGHTALLPVTTFSVFPCLGSLSETHIPVQTY